MFSKLPIVKQALQNLCNCIPENCIGIHGKIYDVTNFDHPGGNTFIEINKGTDVTALFETHHINNKLAQKYLNNLEVVGEYESKIKYDFSSYRKLRENLFEYISKRKYLLKLSRFTQASTIFYIFINIILHNYLFKFNYNNICTDYWSFASFTLCLTSCSIINTILGGFGHNGVHKLNYSSLLLDWNGLSSLEWLLEHVHSHHMYVNSENDNDVLSIRPFLNWKPTDKNSIFATKGKHLIYLFAEILVPLQGNIVHSFRWKFLFKKEYPLFLRLSPLVFVSRILLHIYFQGIIIGIITLLLSLMTAGYYFSYLAHLNHGNINNDENEIDFIKNQIDNTNDIKVNKYLSHLFLSLDNQVFHHLFPTIEHTYLNEIQVLLKNDIKKEPKLLSILNNEVNELLDKFSKKIN